MGGGLRGAEACELERGPWGVPPSLWGALRLQGGRADGYEVQAGSSSRPSCRPEWTEVQCPWAQCTLSASRGQEDREPGDAGRKFGGHRVRCSAVGFAL